MFEHYPLISRQTFLHSQLIYSGFSMLILSVSLVSNRSDWLSFILTPLLGGISFLSFVGVLFTSIYHRFLHKFHLDNEGD